MPKRYLVTGGLGFIGAPLVQRLVREGHRVRVLDNSSRGSKEKLGDIVGDTEIIAGDVRDPRVVSRAVKGAESVVHLAYVNGTEYFYKYPAYILDVGVKGMVNVLDSCIRCEVKELVVASSSEVYQTPPKIPTDEFVPLSIPDPLNPRYSYGGGKILSELMTLNYGREHFERVLLFRPHNVYGPAMGWEHVISQFIVRCAVLKKKQRRGPISFPIQGGGKQTRAFIFIEDFTDGLMRVLKKGKHMNIYHIGTMEEVTIGKLARVVAQCMALSIKIVPGKAVEGGTLRRCPDISKLKALGFLPKFSLKDGIERTIPWYIEHPKAPIGQHRNPCILPLPV